MEKSWNCPYFLADEEAAVCQFCLPSNTVHQVKTESKSEMSSETDEYTPCEVLEKITEAEMKVDDAEERPEDILFSRQGSDSLTLQANSADSQAEKSDVENEVIFLFNYC